MKNRLHMPMPMRLRFVTDDSEQGAGTTSTEGENAEGAENGKPEGSTSDGDKAGDPPASRKDDEDKELDELPEWARKKLTKANSEAARYRTELREAQEKLQSAKTVEEFEAATKELADKNAELEQALLRERVARKHNLPDALADRLRGSTEEELVADAKALAKLVAAPDDADPSSLGGGLDPSDDADFDPVKAAREARSRRY